MDQIMELIPLAISPPPGVVLTETERVVEGRWIASINIRFSRGRPQKIGGNRRATTQPTSGVPRSAHAWRDNFQNSYLAVGTYRKLYAYDPSFLQTDITPYRSEGTLGTDPLAVEDGSNIVTVTHVLHGLNFGDAIEISGADPIGGITPNGSFTVLEVVNANTYTYTFTSAATSTDASGGGSAVEYKYEVPIGVELGVYGLGYGVGGYGLEAYGEARTESTIFIEPRIWSLDHFGKILIAAYNGGSIYTFDPTQAQPWPRASIMSADPGLPTNCRFVFVTNERFVFALLDSMQVAWCSQGDYTVWTPAVDNTANIRTLTEGTKLVAGRVLSDFISLVWSDAAVFRFQYTGSTYIYNSSMIAKDCGLISPLAAVTASGIAYWMGQNTFWMYNGSVLPMPNVSDIRKHVFDELFIDNGYQCNAIYSPQNNEIWFFYPVAGEINPTRGLIFSIADQCWAPLNFGRTCGTHFTQGDTRPYAGRPDGYIYQHEFGYDDDGAPLPWSITLSPYAMNEGGSRTDVEMFVPDFKEQVGDITMAISTWDRLNDSAVEDTETDTVTPLDSGAIDTRISGRYIGLMLSGNTAGCYFRLGKPVAWIRPSGARG